MIISVLLLAMGLSPACIAMAVYDVADYGATPNRHNEDQTPFFEAALAAALHDGGGTVYAGPGVYGFGGHLAVPSGVTLRGSYNVVPAHNMVKGGPIKVDGTMFEPKEGRGNEDENMTMPFISLGSNALAAGFVVHYIEQERIQTPVPYPWTFYLHGNNAAVTDVEILGSWNGIKAVAAPRHYIARVQGHPVNIGVLIDKTYDIGRIEDVHFNPWWSTAHPFIEWQMQFGRAFVLGRSDWEYVLNTFAFGYNIGYHFIETDTGSMNGNFLGIGCDLAIYAAVLVEASQKPGILITNGEFTAFSTEKWLPNHTVESSQVIVKGTNHGAVKFVDSSFWGPNSQTAIVDGTGSVTFSNCEFVQWDDQPNGGKGDGRAAIHVKSGSLILQGNNFRADKPQVSCDAGASKLVALGNTVAGTLRMSVASNSTIVQVGLNAADA